MSDSENRIEVLVKVMINPVTDRNIRDGSTVYRFYDPGRIAIVIGQDGQVTEVVQDRSEFLR